MSQAAGGWPRRDCTHPRARHRHGTRSAYVKDRCRCEECTKANTARSRAVERAQLYGRWEPFIDATPTHRLLRALRADGIGVHQIAHLTGLSASHIRTLTSTRPDGTLTIQRVRQHTADSVALVRAGSGHRAPHCLIDGTGTRRRLQALAAIGWPDASLAQHLHCSPSALRRLRSRDRVTAMTALRVERLYDQVSHTVRSDRAGRQTALTASAAGWLAPLDWDDIANDPERARHAQGVGWDIDEVAVERAVAGRGLPFDRLTPTEQAEAVRMLTQRGMSIRDIARQLSTSRRTVSRHRSRCDSASR